jgi:sugar phosphate isomerase/epimerase
VTVVYLSTVCPAQPRDLWQILDAYRDLGVQTVELGMCNADNLADLPRRLQQYPFTYLVHGNFPPPTFVPNVASPDPEHAERSLDHVRRSIQLAAELGNPFYSMHPGMAVDPIGYSTLEGHLFPGRVPDRAHEAASERFFAAVAEALRYATERGLGLLVENSDVTPAKVGKVLVGTEDEARRLLEAVPGIGLLIDTGHLSVTAATYGFDRVAFVRNLRAHVAALHLHDNDGRLDSHDPPNGTSWIFDALESLDISATRITAEARVASPAQAVAHQRWLSARLS